MKKTAISLAWIGVWILGVWFFATYSAGVLHALSEHSTDPELAAVFIAIIPIFLLSFISFYLAKESPLPSFVIALVLGIAAHPLLEPIIANRVALGAIVSIGATLILFQGGLETSFVAFRRLFGKIAMLAFPGVLLSAVLFSNTIAFVGGMVDAHISITAALLLGVLLASTDPAAIIPLFQGIRFKNPATKDIVVSESAMNDVVGALLTLVLVGIAVTTGGFTSIASGFSSLLTPESGLILVEQLFFGVIAGVGGYVCLLFLSKHKQQNGGDSGADASFFIFVPMIAFATALEFGGSGYLAAFIAGLVFHLTDHLKSTERFYGHVIDGFAKPAIFLFLGALVDPVALAHYAPVGIISGILFMFVLRPFVVFSMLGLFMFFGKEKLTFKELLFISWVRETGAIPAVLLVTIVGLGLPNVEALVPVGMWVILLTLVVQPPLTTFFAHKLSLVETK